MPRLAHSVLANIPAPKNQAEDVFYSAEGQFLYLKLVRLYCQKLKLSFLAYGLMVNYVRLVLIPLFKEGLQQILKPLHLCYFQQVNKINGWQARFFSSALGEDLSIIKAVSMLYNPHNLALVVSATLTFLLCLYLKQV